MKPSVQPIFPVRRSSTVLWRVLWGLIWLGAYAIWLRHSSDARSVWLPPVIVLLVSLTNGLSAGQPAAHLLARLLCLAGAFLCVGLACWVFAHSELIVGGCLLISALMCWFFSHSVSTTPLRDTPNA